MALYKCGGGGALSETVLWTNSSPSSSFAAQNITLNQTMSNFKYLKFEWSAGINLSSIKGSNIYEVDYIKRTDSGTGTSSTPKLKFVLNTGRFTGYCHAREGYYVSDTQVYVDSTKLIGGTAPNNATNYVIPLKIIGLK